MFYNPIFWLLTIHGLLLGLYAQSRVKGAFSKYSKVKTHRNVTGAQVARSLLDSQGLSDVTIERVPGNLSDHYDPRSKVLRLSESVYDQPSVAAAGVAAHEMGHAVQDASNYGPLGLRSAFVPAANFGSKLGPLLFMGGFFLNIFVGGTFGFYVAWLGVFVFAAAVIFTLITLPVEFDASKRAKKLLVSNGILFEDEMVGVNRVLDAAALTYVASAVSAIGQLLYYVAILGGSRD